MQSTGARQMQALNLQIPVIPYHKAIILNWICIAQSYFCSWVSTHISSGIWYPFQWLFSCFYCLLGLTCPEDERQEVCRKKSGTGLRLKTRELQRGSWNGTPAPSVRHVPVSKQINLKSWNSPFTVLWLHPRPVVEEDCWQLEDSEI